MVCPNILVGASLIVALLLSGCAQEESTPSNFSPETSSSQPNGEKESTQTEAKSKLADDAEKREDNPKSKPSTKRKKTTR